MCLRFTGKMFGKIYELSPINGFQPATHEKGHMPILNRLRPKGIFERDRCASGWSDIYVHSTNPVKKGAENDVHGSDRVEMYREIVPGFELVTKHQRALELAGSYSNLNRRPIVSDRSLFR